MKPDEPDIVRLARSAWHDREVRTDAPKGYDVPITAALPFVSLAAVFLLVFGPTVGIASLGGISIGFVRQRRSELRLTPDDAFVSEPFGDRVVRWRDVTAVHRSSRWSGGLVLVTRSDRIRCPAPCSWWGGPASPAQVAEVERWWLDHRGTGPDPTI